MRLCSLSGWLVQHPKPPRAEPTNHRPACRRPAPAGGQQGRGRHSGTGTRFAGLLLQLLSRPIQVRRFIGSARARLARPARLASPAQQEYNGSRIKNTRAFCWPRRCSDCFFCWGSISRRGSTLVLVRPPGGRHFSALLAGWVDALSHAHTQTRERSFQV